MSPSPHFLLLLLPTILFAPQITHSHTLSSPSISPDTQTCLHTSTHCLCAPSPPSKLCPRRHAPQVCVLATCQARFQCDCDGFELCTILPCAKFAPLAGESINATHPFPCSLQKGNSTCLTVIGSADSIVSAHNAIRTAKQLVQNTKDDVVSLGEQYVLVIIRAAEVHALVDLAHDGDDDGDPGDPIVSALLEREAYTMEDALDTLSEIILHAVHTSGRASLRLADLQVMLDETMKKDELVANHRRVVEGEQVDMTRSDDVEIVHTQIAALEMERRLAARECGKIAREVRDYRKTVKGTLQEIMRVHQIVDRAYTRCVEAVNSSIGKVTVRVDMPFPQRSVRM